MKKLALFIVLTMLATTLFAFNASAAVDGVMADAAPASYGVLADFNPEAIVEDINGIVGDQVAVDITGSKGISSIAAHSSAGADNVSVTLVEENGEKFVRLENTTSYAGKYSQFYFNLDTAVFTAPEEYYFSITFRLSKGYTCTDGTGRAVLARLVDGVQNNCVIVKNTDLAAKDFSEWTTLTFSFNPANAPYVMRIITFCNPSQYIDIKDFKVYAASVTPEPVVTEAPVTEAPVTEAPVTEAPATEAPVTDAPVVTTVAPAQPEDTPATGDATLAIFAASLIAVVAMAVVASKKVRS